MAGIISKNNSVVFSNSKQLPIESIDAGISIALIEGQWFYADKWKLKDVHRYNWDSEIDHEWHEYDCVEEVDEEITEGDIADFLKLIAVVH